MKLLLLIPNFVLMAIAGYNLANEFEKNAEPNYLLFKLLHAAVLLITIVFAYIIVKSMFTIRYMEVQQQLQPEDMEYNKMEIQHS